MQHLLTRIHRFLLPDDEWIGRMPYVWLIHLAFLFFPLTLGQGGSEFWVATLASMAVFLPVYFWAFHTEGRRAILPVGIMLGLCFLATPANPAALTYAVFAAAFAHCIVSGRQGLVAVAAVAAVAAVIYWWHSVPLPFAIMGVVMPLLVGVSNVYFATLHEKNAEIRMSQQEVRRLAGQAERERIARDLHDLLGHTLSVMIRKTELARRLIETDRDQAAVELQEIEGIGRQALGQVREAVSGWRAPELAAEAAGARLALESSGITAQVDETPPIDQKSGETLAMVLREAITNVIRHSGARHCQIEFARESADWLVRVSDDGRGGCESEGNGIRGMRERLAELGGELEVESGDGCTLTARVPIGNRQEQAA